LLHGFSNGLSILGAEGKFLGWAKVTKRPHRRSDGASQGGKPTQPSGLLSFPHPRRIVKMGCLWVCLAQTDEPLRHQGRVLRLRQGCFELMAYPLLASHSQP